MNAIPVHTTPAECILMLIYNFYLFSEQMEELTARLQGPQGPPGAGFPGAPGEPGPQGSAGKSNVTVLATYYLCISGIDGIVG